MISVDDRCAICGSAYHMATHGGFAFGKCSQCGYGSLLAREHREDYWIGAAAPDPTNDFWVASKRDYFRSALALFEREIEGRRLLDVGGGVGFFAELALRQGWDAYSLDISQLATDVAARRVGADRAMTSLDGAFLGAFDVVTAWCVIAHTRDPRELITEASRALRPGGIIWLTTPNFNFQKPYAAFRSSLRRPIDFEAEDHVGHFTASAMKSLLLSCGFSAPRFHFRGVNQIDMLGASRNSFQVGAKSTWNRVTFTLARLGLPNYISELQVTARLTRPPA